MNESALCNLELSEINDRFFEDWKNRTITDGDSPCCVFKKCCKKYKKGKRCKKCPDR